MQINGLNGFSFWFFVSFAVIFAGQANALIFGNFPYQQINTSLFENISNKGIAGGYAPLNASGKINETFLPPSGGGVTNHSLLTNLNADDHPQYLNGTRAQALFYYKNQTNTTSEIQSMLSGFENFSNKNMANGYVGLDEATLIPIGFIPNINTSQINPKQLGGLTSTLDHLQSDLFSTGWIEGGVITDNGDATFNVSTGEGLIREEDSHTGTIYYTAWPDAGPFAVTEGSDNYAVVAYNGGVPEVQMLPDHPTDMHTNIYLGEIHYENGAMRIHSDARRAGDFIERMSDTWAGIIGHRVASGSALSDAGAGTRKIYVTAGSIYAHNLDNIITLSFNSSVANNNFTVYYTDGAGGFKNETQQTQWNNTAFADGAGGLTVMNAGNYSIMWFMQTYTGEIGAMYDTAQYSNLSQSETASLPVVRPELFEDHGWWIGHIVFQKSGSAPLEIWDDRPTIGGSSTRTSGSSNHNDLAGLQGGVGGQYYHLNATQFSNVALTSMLGGYENTSNKGIAGGYAPLNASGFISTSNLSGVELSANKGAASGYCPLNASTKIDASYIQGFSTVSHIHDIYLTNNSLGVAGYAASLNATGVIPDAQIYGGITRDTELANYLTNGSKGIAGGVAPLNASGFIDTSNLSGVSLVGHAHAGYENTSNKNATNGYPNLTSDRLVPASQLGVGTNNSNSFLAGNLTWRPMPNFENASNKGIASGYAPLNSSGKIDVSNLSGVVFVSDKNASNGVPNLTADRLVPSDQLATGANSSSTYLRGDRTWASIGGGSPHTILDGSTHTDSAVGTVARGDIITGQSATPKWTRLAKGTANQVLSMDGSGTDVVWATPSSSSAQSPTSMMGMNRWWRIQQNDGLTTVFNDGFTTAPQQAGTATNFPDLDGYQYINYTTIAAANRSGWNSTAYTVVQTRNAPVFTAIIKTGNLLNSSLFIGLTNFTMHSTASPTGMALMFNYNSSTDTNFWRTWVTNGTAYNTRNTTTIAIANNTRYVLTINASNQNNVTFWVNGVLADYQTYGTGPNNTNLGYTVMIKNHTVTAVTLGISNIFMEHK